MFFNLILFRYIQRSRILMRFWIAFTLKLSRILFQIRFEINSKNDKRQSKIKYIYNFLTRNLKKFEIEQSSSTSSRAILNIILLIFMISESRKIIFDERTICSQKQRKIESFMKLFKCIKFEEFKWTLNINNNVVNTTKSVWRYREV